MAKGFKLLDASQGRPRLDRYELIAELAAGGMATVFLARIGGAGGFQRFVAIKRLHPHLAHEPEFVEMFLDEARLAASIHHPNVVPILEVGESPGGYYLVMEYIEGDTLWNLRNAASATRPGNKLPQRVALRIVHEALLGLHAAHELRDEAGQPLNLVHRDVSPQNILIGVDGTSRITDFGVARAASRLSSTRSGEIKGKMAYMSPEQVGARDLDRRSDLFAMGIVLWEALANKHLFLGPNEVVTMHRVLNEPIPALTTVLPGLSKRISDVVAKALERDVEQRFATCLEMAEALEAAARSALPLPPAREVGATVEQLVGPRLAERKEAVSRWLATSQPTVGMTGTYQALSASNLPALPGVPGTPLPGPPPASQRMPLPPPTPPPRVPPGGLPPPTPPPRVPPLAPVDSLSTGSSLSPLLASPPTTTASTPPPALPASGAAPTRSSPLRRAAPWAVPALLLLALSAGWAVAHRPEAGAAPAASASTSPAAASSSPPALAASTAPAAPATSSEPSPPASASSEPAASASSRPQAKAPPAGATRGKDKPPPVSTGLDSSPYR